MQEYPLRRRGSIGGGMNEIMKDLISKVMGF
jgi:hypothetical protein